MDTVKNLERRKLKDCVQIIDRGMQLEDWEEHTPERMPEALDEIQKMARKTLFKG